MKKVIVLISTAMFGLAGLAAASPSNWVVAGNDKINCEKISFGIKKARIVLESGEKMVVPIAELEAYSMNGLMFDKKVVYKNGEATNRTAFMQLLRKKGDLSLYKSVEYNPDSVDPLEARDQFYIYKGDEMYLALDNKSIPNVFKFFNLKMSFK